MSNEKPHRISEANGIFLKFLSDYLESSSGLAEAALSGIQDYCEHFNITLLEVGKDDLDYDSEMKVWREGQAYWKAVAAAKEAADASDE